MAKKSCNWCGEGLHGYPRPIYYADGQPYYSHYCREMATTKQDEFSKGKGIAEKVEEVDDANRDMETY